MSEYEKLDALNLMQYTILAIIPITILNKVIKKTIPELDESKGSLELFFEVVAQLLIIILGIYFTNKIIINIPTYSGASYPEIELYSNVLNIIMFALTIQTKLSDKINIIYNRVMQQLNGSEGFENVQKKDNSETSGNSNSNGNSSKEMTPMPTNISATANMNTNTTTANANINNSNDYMATLNEDLEEWNRKY